MPAWLDVCLNDGRSHDHQSPPDSQPLFECLCTRYFSVRNTVHVLAAQPGPWSYRCSTFVATTVHNLEDETKKKEEASFRVLIPPSDEIQGSHHPLTARPVSPSAHPPPPGWLAGWALTPEATAEARRRQLHCFPSETKSRYLGRALVPVAD